LPRKTSHIESTDLANFFSNIYALYPYHQNKITPQQS